MAYLASETARLAAAMASASRYAQQSRARFDPTAPGAAGRLRHLEDVETALQGTRDFVAAVDALLHPAPTPLMQRVAAHLAQPGLQARLGYAHPIRHALAAITAFHLPRNPALPDEPA